LYSYDLITSDRDKHLSLPNSLVYNSAKGANGKIYFTDISESSDYTEVYSYDLETEELTVFASIENWLNSQPFYVDKSNNLWLGPAGYISPSGDLTRLYPEEYREEVLRSFGRSSYHTSARIFLENANGYIWFGKNRMIDNGVAWYDPISKDSCWFTDYFGNVIIDNTGTLWFEIDGSLYSNSNILK